MSIRIFRPLLFSPLLLFFMIGKTQTTMIISDSYNEKKNQTTLILFPYGNITLPDRWTKSGYNEVSKQHFFTNSDSTTIALAKNPKKSYPFFKSRQNSKEFVTKFVKWDSDYWESKDLNVKIINDKSDDGFIIWQVTSRNDNSINTIFLFGSNGDFAYNFSGSSKSWTDKKIEDFLVNLFYIN